MKSERRHELQHNALLDWLMQTGSSIKPYLNAILLGIVVVVLGVAAYKYMSNQSADEEAIAWDSMFEAMGTGEIDQLDQTVEDYPSTSAAQWAAVVAGDLRLSAGCQDLFTTKATAADQFQKALDKYTLVLESCREAVLRERATYGLARTYEAMAGTRRSQEDLARAKTEYEKVVQEWPDGAYAKAAQARLNALSQTSTLEFYDALAAWEPRPAITSPSALDGLNIPFGESGEGLTPGATPTDFLKDITDRIDESMEAPAEGEPSEGAGETSVEIEIPEVPAMPPATGDQPAGEADEAAEKADKPAAEEGSE